MDRNRADRVPWRTLAAILFSTVVLAGSVRAQSGVRVEFDPNWTPPPGAGTRAQATAAILSQLQSKFAFAGTTMQIVTSGNANHTLRYIPSNSTSFFSSRFGRPFTTAAWGATIRHTSWVFGSEFNNETVFNNSTAISRGATATGAHEIGHGHNATHTPGGAMKTSTTPAEKAGTSRSFTTANQSRIISAARVMGAVPGAPVREAVTPVWSHGCPNCPPQEKPEENFFVNANVNVSDPNWNFGFMNDFNLFVPSADPLAGPATVLLQAAQPYDFALRSRFNSDEVLRLSVTGTSSFPGPLHPPALAVMPVLVDSYSQVAHLQFQGPQGPIMVDLTADGTNGFTRLLVPLGVPGIQTWGMVVLLAVLLLYGCYRARGMIRFAHS